MPEIDEVKAWKFSKTAIAEKPDIFHGETVKEFLSKKYDYGYTFGKQNLLSHGVYKLLGWMFDFRPYLRSYVFRQHDILTQYWAPNRTMLRRAVGGRMKILCECEGPL